MYSLALCFFFDQKHAYEMRISYWSSDVCSSDLSPLRSPTPASGSASTARRPADGCLGQWDGTDQSRDPALAAGPGRRMALHRSWKADPEQIGSASCRARGCQYV